MPGAGDGLKKGFLVEDEPVEMPESLQALKDRLKRDFAECARLRTVKNDEARPFESRYEERRVLQKLKKSADAFAEQVGGGESAGTLGLQGAINGLLGSNFVETEEPGAGTAPLTLAVEQLGDGPEELLHRLEALSTALPS